MTVRIIQVGMGGWGRNWMNLVLSKSPHVEVVAWVEVIPAVLEIAREQFSLPVEKTFTNLDQALASVECDAVLVTASLAGHIPSVLTALKAGKHVLLEKPFAPTLEEAQTAVTLADEQQRILMVSQNYRFFPAIQAARELLRSGKMGAMGAVRIDFRKYSNTAPRGSHVHYTIWHPLLVDMSIHHYDLLRYVLDQNASSVFCQTWNPAWSNFDGPAAASAVFTLEDGTVISYNGSWVSTAPATPWGGEWQIECAKGEIIMRSRGDGIPDYLAVRYQNEKELQELSLPEMTDTDRRGSLHAFVGAIESGKQPESSGRDNLNTLALMFATVASADQGGVPVKL
jgi:predicted dehydrogenase